MSTKRYAIETRYRLCKADTITEILAGAGRVITVKRQDDGLIRLTEACDDYFSVTLTPAQLYAWADELKRIAVGLPFTLDSRSQPS